MTFSSREKYDILDIHFGEMEAPDEWLEYQSGALIAIRDELMAGDQRALYIARLASYPINEGDSGEDYDEDEDYGNARTMPRAFPLFCLFNDWQSVSRKPFAVAQPGVRRISARPIAAGAWRARKQTRALCASLAFG